MKIDMKKYFTLLFIMFVMFSGCSREKKDQDYPGSFEVLFTDPYGDEDILQRAIELISSAEKTIDVESYGFDINEIADSLIAAHNRGISVRIVCERDNYESDTHSGDPYWDMQNAGIPIVPDNDNSSLTHDKVMIIDSAIVWTGSTNFTFNGYYLNNNNVLIIESEDVAKTYLEDFSQMFAGDFHTQKTSDGAEKYPVADGSVEIWFSPEDSPDEMLIQNIQNAEQSIYFCIFAFTLDDLSSAMINAADRGISVHGIFDESSASDSSVTQYYTLLSAGIDVELDPCPYAFHHKFIVIDPDGDDPKVITGSGNFSYSGTHQNDENFVVVHSRSIAQKYLDEFERWKR